MFAASHVDVDVTVGADDDHITGAGSTSGGGPTVGGLVRRVGAALLLVGCVQEAAVVAAALLGRYGARYDLILLFLIFLTLLLTNPTQSSVILTHSH